MTNPAGPMTLTSPDFEHCGPMPQRFGADFDNVAPTLVIEGVPEGTVELALFMIDPDSGSKPEGFTHWVVYGIPPETTELHSNASTLYLAGPNETGDTEYFGPRPRPGHGKHNYYFLLYALDKAVTRPLSRREFFDTYTPHVLAKARIAGVFENLN